MFPGAEGGREFDILIMKILVLKLPIMYRTRIEQ
jgi:hypothetical protein